MCLARGKIFRFGFALRKTHPGVTSPRFGYALRKTETHPQAHSQFKTISASVHKSSFPAPGGGGSRLGAGRRQRHIPALRLRLAQIHPTGKDFHATRLWHSLTDKGIVRTLTAFRKHSGVFPKHATSGQKIRRRVSASPLRLRLAGDTVPDTSQGKEAARRWLWIVRKNISPLFPTPPRQGMIAIRIDCQYPS